MEEPSASRSISVEVNGDVYEREVDARRLLVHFLRDDLDLTGVFSGAEEGFAYFAVYLTAMFFAGLLALFLALVGASAVRERAWVAVAAGAMAMTLVMVPVVYVAGHEINHWGGCVGCGSGGGGD